MLTEQERRAVTLAIGEHLAVVGPDYSVIGALVGDIDFTIRLAAPSPPSPIQWARTIVKQCEDDAWAHVPPYLVNLLGNLPPAWPELSVVMDRIKSPPPGCIGSAANTPVDVLWLARVGMPFVDRGPLRDHLKRMRLPASTATPAVLAISGPAVSGRSFTVELLHHLVREDLAEAMLVPAAQRPAEGAVGVVAIPSKEGASMTPQVLADLFAEVMLAPRFIAPANADTPDRISQYLSERVFRRAIDTGHSWWLVLDGLDDPDLSDHIIGFVGKLAEQVTQHTAEPPVRLVLIGCPQKVVDILPKTRLAQETLSQVGELDLNEFFAQLLIAGGISNPPELAVRLAVFLALNDLPTNSDRLPELNRRLRASADQVCHA